MSDSNSSINKEILEAEVTLVRELLPEFDDVDARQLTLVMELLCTQWLVFEVVRNKDQAFQVNDMLLAMVYRVIDGFPDFEKDIMIEKMKDDQFVDRSLKAWLKKKGELQQRFSTTS